MSANPARDAAAEVQGFLSHPDNTGLGDVYSLALGVIFRRVRKDPEHAAEIVKAVEEAVRELEGFACLDQ